jgi:hypothetical protein
MRQHGLDDYANFMRDASNMGKRTDLRLVQPKDYADEPTNYEYRLEQWAGWRWIGAWAVAGLVGWALLGFAAWGLFKIVGLVL